MSWLFSQALVAEFWGVDCSAGEQSAPSNETPIVQAYWCDGKTTDASLRSPFGTMCEHLTDAHGKVLLAWFLEASRVKTSQALGNVRDWTESLQDWSSKCCELLEKLGHRLYLPKTRRIFALEDSTVSSKNWPTWGTNRGGVCLEIATRAGRPLAPDCGWLPNNANEIFTWIPRPTARLYGHNKGGAAGRVGKQRPSLETVIGIRIDIRELLMDWPIGWTALGPLAMDKWQAWLRSPGQS